MRSILLYTTRQWGAKQRDAYLEEIDKALELLGERQRLGRPRSELKPGLRSYRIQQHVIYYRLEEGAVVVLRILHEKMEAAHSIDEA